MASHRGTGDHLGPEPAELAALRGVPPSLHQQRGELARQEPQLAVAQVDKRIAGQLARARLSKPLQHTRLLLAPGSGFPEVRARRCPEGRENTRVCAAVKHERRDVDDGLAVVGLVPVGPSNRGEVIYYNLGKFSQVISDFEQIHFQSEPKQKCHSFADHLKYQVESIYPEGWLETRYVMPNAVQIMTIHQAKGLEWPVVFVPGLVRGRFPVQGAGGVQPWSVIPGSAVRNKDDYRTTEEDERRLF